MFKKYSKILSKIINYAKNLPNFPKNLPTIIAKFAKNPPKILKKKLVEAILKFSKKNCPKIFQNVVQNIQNYAEYPSKFLINSPTIITNFVK